MTQNTISNLKCLSNLQLQMILSMHLRMFNRYYMSHKTNYRIDMNPEMFDENYEIKWTLIK